MASVDGGNTVINDGLLEKM